MKISDLIAGYLWLVIIGVVWELFGFYAIGFGVAFAGMWLHNRMTA